MEVGSPEWIEASLARLDLLERQRGEHEAALESATDPAVLKQHNDALEQLDSEIKTLYAQLEAVAGEEEEQDEEDADVAPHVTEGDDELSAPHMVASTPSLAAPPTSPPVAIPAESPFGSSPSEYGGYDAGGLDDDLPKGGGAKWAFVGLAAAIAMGVGGYFAWQNYQAQQQKQQAKPEQVEEIRIESAKVREDTEAPKAAKGGEATISPTAEGYTTGGSSKSSGSSGSGSSGSSSKKGDEKKKKPLEIGSSGDPLG